MDPPKELRKQTFTAQGRVQKERGVRTKGELALEASYSCRQIQHHEEMFTLEHT